MEGDRRVKQVVGIGVCVQGFRCFPWLAVNYFLKDTMRMEPSELQLLQNSANLPMVAKPLYGILSDALYIRGQHRLPYIAIGVFFQALSWLAIAFFPESSISVLIVTAFLLLGNLGASLAEVANDAILAEAGRQSRDPSDLQSFAWTCASSAGIVGNLLGGILISMTTSKSMFFLYGVLLVVQLLLTIHATESSLNLPKMSQSAGIRKQLSELKSALRKSDLFFSIAWLSGSYAVVPVLTGTMFFYQTQHLKLDPAIIGFSKVVGQAASLAWSVAYNKCLNRIPSRKLLSWLQATMAAFMVSDVLFVKGIYSTIGVPDSVYAVIFSGLLEVIFFFKLLPFSVLVARLCPSGCEGSVMAVVMSSISLAMIVSGYLGVALAAIFGVSGQDFSGLPVAILVQATCTLLPLCWSSWIPDSSLEKKEA